MASGLQEAETAFQSMLTGTPPDNQQEVSAETEAEVEPEESTEVDTEESTDAEITTEEDEQIEEQEEPEEEYHAVKLDGQDYEVTLPELKDGYLRQSDYTKKTQALAESRKQLEAAQEAAKQEQLRYQQNLDRLVSEQQSQQPQEPDWDQLYEADPLEWMKQKEDARSRKEKQAELQQEHMRMQQQQAQEQQAQMQEYITQQHQTLIETIPEWKDPEVMKQEKSQIRQYAQSIGYSQEELANIYDHRAVLALRSGMKAAGLSGKGKVRLKPAKEAIRPATPGSAGNQPRKHTSVSKAKMKLAKSGKMSDATEVFKQML